MFESLTADDQNRIRADLRIALTGGAIAALLMIGVEILVGNVGDWEAQAMIQKAQPTLRSFASTIMIVTSSALALMLTILGLTGEADQNVRGGHFERIRQIGLAATTVFIAATLLFMVLFVSPDQTEGVPVNLYNVVYLLITGLSSLIGGAVVGIVLMIYTAVRDIATTFGPGDKSPLTKEEDES